MGTVRLSTDSFLFPFRPKNGRAVVAAVDHVVDRVAGFNAGLLGHVEERRGLPVLVHSGS